MKTIGLIGGLSWESTNTYYRLINEHTRRRLGGLHSAPCLLYSFDFDPIEKLQSLGQWSRLTDELVHAATMLREAGAQILIICSNTMHKTADELIARVRLPLLHIADATGSAIRGAGLRRIGLLGTRFTMEENFYRARLEDRFALRVGIPEPDDRAIVDETIYAELCRGLIRESSRERFRGIISRLVAMGSEGIILGCTEIGLLVDQSDSPVPLFDTTLLHATAAVELALAGAATEQNVP
jgi:aspartate racemase